MENLNKKNFWNRIFETYPNACKEFCDWIDKWKEENGTQDWYFKTRIPGLEFNIKFHDYPLAMQAGIFIEFASNQGCSWETDLVEFDLAIEIEEWMKHREEQILDDFLTNTNVDNI